MKLLQYNQPFYQPYEILETNGIFTTADQTGGAHLFGSLFKFDSNFKGTTYLPKFITSPYANGYNRYAFNTFKDILLHLDKSYEFVNNETQEKQLVYYNYERAKKAFKEIYGVQKNEKRYKEVTALINQKKPLLATQADEIVKEMMGIAQKEFLQKGFNGISYETDMNFFEGRLYQDSLSNRIGQMQTVARKLDVSEQLAIAQTHANRIPGMHYFKGSKLNKNATKPSVIGFFNGNENYYETFGTKPFQVIGAAPNSYGGYNLVNLDVHYAENKLEKPQLIVTSMQDTGIRMPSAFSSSTFGEYKVVSQQGMQKSYQSGAETLIWRTINQVVYDTSLGMNDTIDMEATYGPIHTAIQKTHLATTPNYLTELSNMGTFLFSNGLKEDSVRDQLDLITLSGSQYKGILGQFYNQEGKYNKFIKSVQDVAGTQDFDFSFQVGFDTNNKIKTVTPIFLDRKTDTILYGFEGLGTQFKAKKNVVENAKKGLTSTFNDLTDNFKGIFDRSDLVMFQGEQDSKFFRRLTMFDDDGNNLMKQWNDRISNIFDNVTKSNYYENKKFASDAEQIRYLVSQTSEFKDVVNDISENVAKNSIRILGLDEMRFQRNNLFNQYQMFQNGEINALDYLKNAHKMINTGLGNSDYIAGIQGRIEEAIELSDPTRIASFLSSGNILENLNMVAKQSSNINAKKSAFLGHTSMFSYLNIENQRHAQTDDRLTPFSIGGETIGQMVSKYTRHVPGLESTGYSMVNESSVRLGEEIFKRSKLEQFGNEKNLIKQINSFEIPRTFQSNRGMVLIADTEIAWQDSNRFSNKAILETIGMSDKLKEITISGNNNPEAHGFVDFTKIKKFGSEDEYYPTDFDFFRISKKRASSSINIYNPNTEEGYIIQQILGEKNYERMIRGNNPENLKKDLQQALSPLSTLKASTIENVDYNAKIYDTTLSNVKDILLENTVAGDHLKRANPFSDLVQVTGEVLNSSDYYLPVGMKVTPEGFTFQFQPLVTAGIGSKLITNPQKATVGGINPIIGLVNKETGNILNIDMVANLKMGHEKRGFNGALFSNMFQGMYSYIAATPLSDELLEGETYDNLSPTRMAEIQQARIDKFTKALHQKDMRLSVNGASVFDIFDIDVKTSVNSNGQVELGFRDIHYEKALDRYMDMYHTPTASIEHMAIEEMYRKARLNGIRLTDDNIRAFGETLKSSMIETYWSYLQENYSPEQASNMKMFYNLADDGLELAVSAQGTNGLFEMTGVKTNSNWVMLFPSFLNNMKDSTSQKKTGAMKFGWLTSVVQAENGLDVFNAIHFGEAARLNQKDLNLKKALFGVSGYERFSEKYNEIFGEGIRIADITGGSIDKIPSYISPTNLLNTASYGFQLKKINDRIAPLNTHLDFRGYHGLDFLFTLGQDDNHMSTVKNYGFFSILNEHLEKTKGQKINKNMIFNRVSGLKATEEKTFLHKVASENILSFTTDEIEKLRSDFMHMEDNLSSMVSERLGRYEEILKHSDSEALRGLSSQIQKNETLNAYIKNTLLVDLYFKTANDGSPNKLTPAHLSAATDFLLSDQNEKAKIKGAIERGIKIAEKDGNEHAAMLFNFMNGFRVNGEQGSLDNIEYILNSIKQGSMAVSTGAISVDNAGMIVHNKPLTALNDTLFYLSKMKEFENIEQMSKIANSGLFEEIEQSTGHNYGVFKYIGQTRKFTKEEDKIKAQRAILKNMLFHRIDEINKDGKYISTARSEEFGQFLLDTFEKFNTHTTYDARSLGQGKLNASNGKLAMDDGLMTLLFDHEYKSGETIISEYNREMKKLKTDPIRVLSGLRKIIDEGPNVKSQEQHAIQAQAKRMYGIIEEYFISKMDDYGKYFDYSLEDLNASGLSASDMREGLTDAYDNMLLWFGSGLMKNEKGWLQTFNNGLLTRAAKFQKHFLNSLVKLTEINLDSNGTAKKAMEELLSYSIPHSISIEPSDGTSLLYGIGNYISNGIDSKGKKIGYDKIDSLFISNGKFKESKQLKQDYNDFLKLTKKTFGNILDLSGKELLAEEFQNIYRDIQKGKMTMEEFEARIANFRSHLDYRMNAIDGIAFSSEQMFKEMNVSHEFGKDGYTHGFLHRNPDQYLFSTKANRIVQYTEGEIAKYPFLNAVLGEGRGLVNTQHMFLVGFDNFLASNGDFDGDNAYLLFSSLGKDTKIDAKRAKTLIRKEAQINSEFTNLMKKYRVRENGEKVFNYENLSQAYDAVINGDMNDSLITGLHDNIRALEKMKGRYVTEEEIKDIIEQKFSRFHFEMKRIGKELKKEFKTHDSVIGANTVLKTTVNGNDFSINSETMSSILMTGNRNDIDTIFTDDTLPSDKTKIKGSFNRLINEFLLKNKEWKEKGYKGSLSDVEINNLQKFVAGDEDVQNIEAFRNLYQEFKENKHIASLEANWLGQSGKYKDLVGLSKTGIVHSELTSYRSFASNLIDTTTATAFWKLNENRLLKHFENASHFSDFRLSVDELTHNNIFGVLIEEGAISSKKGAGSATTAAFLGPFRDIYNKIMTNKGEGGPTEGTISLNQKGMRELSKKFFKSSLSGKLDELEDMALVDYLIKIGMNVEDDTDISKIDNIMDIISSVDRKTGNKMIDGAKKYYSYKHKNFTEENATIINATLSKTAKELGMEIKENGLLGMTLKDLTKLTGMDDDEVIQRLSGYNAVVIKGLFSNQIYDRDRHVSEGIYYQAKKFIKSIPKLIKAMDPMEAENTGGLDPRFSGPSNLITIEEVANSVATGVINKNTIDDIRFQEIASHFTTENTEEAGNVATEAAEKVQQVVENVNKKSSASKVVEEVTTNKNATETVENIQKAAESAQSTAQSIKKNVKNVSNRYGMAATLGFGAVILGGFFKLINQNRTVIDLDLQEQQLEKEKGSLYRNLGQYYMNTNIRDFY
ncbi:methyl-accepting chemotaxis protein [Fusobacterium necrophorum]|uniref:Uncharacterized protein n=1 Tax=Fusobacterium necrophorum subsp. funduliforme TaxID=143387 RepID=A0A162J8P4_9FUSO|nr:hypothetical protein [Fusobacterium necrophorum]KYL05343.1 hypothetical protein A2J07_00985 [Fusobacterium necrophorum subsp. funduliforme]